MPESHNRTSNAANPRGRPGVDSTLDVRAAVLDAAEQLFARQGYAATSVRRISDAAGVTPAMIHYYFGSKESLLRAVLEHALRPLAEVIESLRASDSAPPAQIVKSLMDTVAEHPNLPYLVIREVMLPGGVMQAHFAQHLAPRLGGALPGLVAREQQADRIRGDIPPVTGALAIMALALFPFIVRPVAEQALGLQFSGPGFQAFEADIASLVRGGFAK